MVVAFNRMLFPLIIAFTLTTCCLAFEDDLVSLSFLIWSPPLLDFDFVEEAVSEALRTFLCHDAKVILLDDRFRNVCYQQGVGETALFSNVAKLSMLDFIKQTDPVRTYLAAETTNVLVSHNYDANGTAQGTEWDVNYEVLQMGMNEVEKVKASNATDETFSLEDRIQHLLNESITKGLMRYRLWGTGILMFQLGQKLEDLPENSLTFEEENINADPELDYKQVAIVLRYIGIVMIVGSFSVSTALTYLARRCRRDRYNKEMMATRELADQRGLVTEQGVNLMLDMGRRESERISSTSTTDYFSAAC